MIEPNSDIGKPMNVLCSVYFKTLADVKAWISVSIIPSECKDIFFRIVLNIIYPAGLKLELRRYHTWYDIK